VNPGKDKAVAEIISRLKSAAKGQVLAEGTWGSFAPLLAAHISKELNRPILYIAAHIDDADKAADDLQTFSSAAVETFPAAEGDDSIVDASDETKAQRLKIILQILSGKKNSAGRTAEKFLIPTSIQAICQAIPKSEMLQKNSLNLDAGSDLPIETVVQWLVDNNFENVDRIELPGQFARRGGIIDIFAPVASSAGPAENVSSSENKKIQPSSAGLAVRVEFFGDTVESIRLFDTETQRSVEEIDNISIFSLVSNAPPRLFAQSNAGADKDGGKEGYQNLLNILPADTIIILEEPVQIEEAANTYITRLENPSQTFGWTEIYSAMQNFTQLIICRFGTADEDFIRLNIKSTQQYQQKSISANQDWAGHRKALEQLAAEAKDGWEVYIYCDNTAEISRLNEIIGQTDKQVPANLKLLKGFVSQGFAIDSLKTIVTSHSEFFGQYNLRRVQRPMRQSAPIDTLEDLHSGDYVVHATYGIGKFIGVQTIDKKGIKSEYLTIEFADGIKIHVSARNITLVQKFIGTSPKRPHLSKVGSKKWQKQKEKVTKSVEELAVELLEIQAKRQVAGGFAFSSDSNWQREFEESFPYQETGDQTTAIAEIKADMQQPRAMDRLLCGDVGYGKTELAMRAAFKAVEAAKQVAVLVPTTVLCVQHGRTFVERFSDFPVSIEILNRFKTAKEAADIIERTKEGRVDILIGTHRLLSGDVGFKDLGLVIIDEEQRFGVRHKEKLKKLRINVDVFTMTATPIPRTLHLSLLGLRDISSLTTAPLDRRSIITTVTGYRGETIRKAIIHELNRNGQVFFLHNRVQTIDKKAWEISRLLEGMDIRIAIAHGQMPKHELEKTMIDFVEGRIDCLVCTTIIESGLDIPNANTIIIDNADRFGLAELHQLRGRVGRYKHKAYAYMLLPPSRPITPTASRRLKAIEEYSHLGSGFKIALRDLEIRGAGNILGLEQSGHIQLVGYQMYCEMLAMAVRRLKNHAAEQIPTVIIDIGMNTYIPKNYIPSDRYRMDTYRKIASAQSADELKDLTGELKDVYGPLPAEVGDLMELAEMKIAAARFKIKSITAAEPNLIFSFAENALLRYKHIFTDVAAKPRIVDENTVYLQLQKNYFESKTLISILRKMLSKDL
jgi:transcription-repair coupling factor (superfamily II helicase)